MKKRYYGIFLIVFLIMFIINLSKTGTTYAQLSEFSQEEQGTVIKSGDCGSTEEDNVKFNLYEDGTLYIFGEGAIADDAFYDIKKEVVKVIVDEGITSIGLNVFLDFSEMISVEISSTVESIGMASVPVNGFFYGSYGTPFLYCNKLESIKVSPDNKVYESREECNALIDKKSQVLVGGCKNSFIPEGIEYIGKGAFFGCEGLTAIVIPDSVLSIESSAFEDCTGLETVKLSDNLTDIGVCAFRGCCSLSEIEFPNHLEAIDKYAFEGCLELSDFKIPYSLNAIGERAFFNCSNLRKIIIPSTLEEVGASAFAVEGLLLCFEEDLNVNPFNIAFNIKMPIKENSSTTKNNAIQVAYGDFDGDGKVTLGDVTKGLKLALNIEETTEENLLYCGVDSDKVQLMDVSQYLKVALGIEELVKGKAYVKMPDTYSARIRVLGDALLLTEFEGEQDICGLTEDMYDNNINIESSHISVSKVKDIKNLSLLQKLTLMQMYGINKEDLVRKYFYKVTFPCSYDYDLDNLRMAITGHEATNSGEIILDFGLTDIVNTNLDQTRTFYFMVSKNMVGYDEKPEFRCVNYYGKKW